MFALEHRVRVFVFQVRTQGVQYLLVRHKPRSEWPLGPVIGPVSVGEQMQDAIVREVREETGICRPLHIMELATPEKELFGEIGLVEWPFAYQAGGPADPVHELTPGPTVSDCAWMPFEEAFQRIELPRDRDAIVRLQLHLQ